MKKDDKRGSKGAKDSNSGNKGKRKGNNPVSFDVDAVYNLKESAAILRRCTKFLRNIARKGLIEYRLDSAGYLFSGRALLAYSEGRCLVGKEINVKTSFASN
jgi:hypothetical protein